MENEPLFIGGVEKASLLSFFYQVAAPKGSGFFDYRPGHRLDLREAQGQINTHGKITQLYGRVLLLNFSAKQGDFLDTAEFNQLYGTGTAEKVFDLFLDSVQGQPYPAELDVLHKKALATASLTAEQDLIAGIDTDHSDVMTMVNTFNRRRQLVLMVKQYLPQEP